MIFKVENTHARWLFLGFLPSTCFVSHVTGEDVSSAPRYSASIVSATWFFKRWMTNDDPKKVGYQFEDHLLLAEIFHDFLGSVNFWI